MDLGRTGLESLESLLARLFGFEVHFQDLRLSAIACDGGLAVDEVDREAFGILDGERVAASRGIGHFCYIRDDCGAWNILDPGARD